MSDEFNGPFPGPILYFYDDPEKKRQRIEGAQPPPESVRVPHLAGSGEAEPDAVNYPLLEFPWEPWSQGTQKQSLARQYARWLNEIGARQAGQVPVTARQDLPDLTWQFASDAHRQRFLITIGADRQEFDLIEHVVEYIVQSAARPRGARGRGLRHWYGLTLQRCRDRVVTGSPVPPVWEVFRISARTSVTLAVRPKPTCQGACGAWARARLRAARGAGGVSGGGCRGRGRSGQVGGQVWTTPRGESRRRRAGRLELLIIRSGRRFRPRLALWGCRRGEQPAADLPSAFAV